jgi:5'-deoxynucleotidase YfbR-like HD superfamily hydrolase
MTEERLRPSQLMRRLRRLAFVPRWNVTPMIRRQNVAEHSHMVAVIARWLLDKHHALGRDQGIRISVLEYALDHDQREAVTGDVPSPTKRDPNLNWATVNPVQIIVKVADLLEMMLFIQEEQLMGNRLGTDWIAGDLQAEFGKVWPHFTYRKDQDKPPSFEFYDSFLRMMQRHNHPIFEKTDGTD